MDWTKVLGTGVLLAGAILMKVFAPTIPNEAVLAVIAVVPALWIAKPIAKTLGMQVWTK